MSNETPSPQPRNVKRTVLVIARHKADFDDHVKGRVTSDTNFRYIHSALQLDGYLIDGKQVLVENTAQAAVHCREIINHAEERRRSLEIPFRLNR